jgi:uncharacterized protein (DUF433 family)
MPGTITPPESTRGQLGQGIYSLAELRSYLAFAGVEKDGDRVLDWLGMLNDVAHQPRQPDYSFADLVSLFVVRMLLGKGVKPRRILEAETYLRTRRQTDRPFVCDDLSTDGRFVYFDSLEGPVDSANRGGGQQASLVVIAPYLKRVKYHEGAAVQWSPMDHVVLNPAIQFGEPVIDGTRVLTVAVADAAAGAGVEQAAKWLAVSASAARAAVSFERRLAALRN